MKRILLLIITCLLLSSFILTACTTDPNDTSAQSEDSSFEESSEPPIAESSDIADETSDISEESSDITEETSEVSEESSEVAYIDFYNENIADALGINKIQDYCLCGSEEYEFQAYYPIFIDSIPHGFEQYLIDKKYTTKEELDDFQESRYDQVRGENGDRKKSCVALPFLYDHLKYFSVTKEDYLEFRETLIESYYEYGYASHIPTVRQIEIMFGDFSDEVVMQELKNKTTFYFEKTLYTAKNLAYHVDNETFKRMLKDESFKLYLIDIDDLLRSYSNEHNMQYGSLHNDLFTRVETLKAEMENE